MPVAAPMATAILELLLSRKLGELAAYGATLSLRHNGVNGVPDSLAHKPLSRYTQALHVNRGFRPGGGCHFNFGRVESILQPSMMTTEFRPCGYQAKPPKSHVRVLDLHNCSVMFEFLVPYWSLGPALGHTYVSHGLSQYRGGFNPYAVFV